MEPTMTPTPEQQQAVDLFKTGGSLAIEAGAGTGKTSTLIQIARAAGNRNGQYVAFNKALVAESRPKFPMNVTCNTAHSLAFGAYGREFKHRLDSAYRMPMRQVAGILGIMDPFLAETFDGKPRVLAPGFVATQVSKTVTRFCQSADQGIRLRHVPAILGLDAVSQYELAEMVIPYAQDMWADLQVRDGRLPYRHEHYLKGWQLSGPVIPADFILFDESQDANPVIAAIIAEQAKHSQLIYVGDSQQEIYAWTGAVNALAQVQVDHRTYLTQSFRFGQAIADRANVVLESLDAALRLTGNPAIESKLTEVDPPRAILVRKNATGLTYLLQLQAAGRKAHFVGATEEVKAFAEAAKSLMDTGRSGHPDLLMFDSWAAVQAYVKDEEEGGEDLRLMVKLIDTFGPEPIIAAIDQMPTDARAEITISTAHRSKGREWSSVKLAGDFPVNADSDKADRRLLYVALTRAQFELDDTALVQDEKGTVV